MTKKYTEAIQQGMLFANGQEYILISNPIAEFFDDREIFMWGGHARKFEVVRMSMDDEDIIRHQNGKYERPCSFPFFVITNSYTCDFQSQGRKILIEEEPDSLSQQDPSHTQSE